MADFLIIDGLAVELTDWKRLPDETLGAVVRTNGMTLRSTVRTRKRAWSATTRPYPSTTMDTIRTKCAFGAHVPLGGPAVGFAGAGTITCVLEDGGEDVLPDDSDATYGMQRALSFTVREA